MAGIIRWGLIFLLAWHAGAFAADGEPDPAFSGNGEATAAWPYPIGSARIAVAADGSVFHAATVAIERAQETDLDLAVAKFRPDGQLDTAFGLLGQRTVGFNVIPDGDDIILGVFALPDGGVLLAATADLDAENFTYAAPALIKLTAAGNVDTAFGNNGRVVVTATPWVMDDDLAFSAVVRQPDGKLVFVGNCRGCVAGRLAVALRMSASGVPDASFGDAGWVAFDVERSVSVSAGGRDTLGRIVLAGAQEPEDDHYDRPWLARLTPAGELDTGFGSGTGVSWLSQVPSFNNDWRVRGIAIDRDDSILLALGNGGGAIVRANADGSLDSAFASNGLRDMEREEGSEMSAVAIRSDRRIMVAGYLRHTGGGYDHYIGRLLSDGDLDTDFDVNGVVRIDMVPGELDAAKAIVFSAGRPVIGGYGGDDYRSATVVRFQSGLIFTDDFDD